MIPNTRLENRQLVVQRHVARQTWDVEVLALSHLDHPGTGCALASPDCARIARLSLLALWTEDRWPHVISSLARCGWELDGIMRRVEVKALPSIPHAPPLQLTAPGATVAVEHRPWIPEALQYAVQQLVRSGAVSDCNNGVSMLELPNVHSDTLA